MIVVADTSPLNYLILIDAIHVLPALYQRVVIPSSVHQELTHPGSPEQVSAWAFNLPDWCDVRSPSSMPDPSLALLDEGERDAIQLAIDSGINTILMDEITGRREAIRRHLQVSGTIAVLEKGAQRGLINFRAAFQSLERTNFRISSALRAEFFGRNP